MTDEGDLRGCIRQRRADTEVGPYGVSRRLSVGADLCVRPFDDHRTHDSHPRPKPSPWEGEGLGRGSGIPPPLCGPPPFNKGGCCYALIGPLVKGGWHRR